MKTFWGDTCERLLQPKQNSDGKILFQNGAIALENLGKDGKIWQNEMSGSASPFLPKLKNRKGQKLNRNIKIHSERVICNFPFRKS